MKFFCALFSLIFLSLSMTSDGQTTAAEKPQKNKTLVNVPVTVSDRDGRYITGLEKKDFTLFEDGKEQNIAAFSTFDEPINISLLLDTSGSTNDSLEKIKTAAADFIELLGSKDNCQIVTFDSKINILSKLTSDHETLKKSLAQVQTADKEGSVVYDAVQETVQKAFAGAQGRKVVILLSDGKDFGSALSKKDLISQLEESDISIYTIFYQTGGGFNRVKIEENGTLKEARKIKKTKPKKPKKPKNYSILIPLGGDVYTPEDAKLAARAADVGAVDTLKQISDTTAGRFYQSDTPNLSSVFKKIAGELRQQYQLGYYSNDAENAPVRQIIIKVKRDDAVVQARGKFRPAQL